MITFVVPCWNVGTEIAGLISSLEIQLLSTDEIILVDNGGNIFPEFSNNASQIQIIVCDKPGSYAARNLGAYISKNKKICFLDSDVSVEFNFRQQLKSWENLSCCVGFSVFLTYKGHRPTIYEKYDNFTSLKQRESLAQGSGITAGILVDKAIYQKVGGFKESWFSGGDSAFFKELHRFGYDVFFGYNVIIYHEARNSFSDLASKHSRIGVAQFLRANKVKKVIYILSLALPSFRMCRVFFKNRSFGNILKLILLNWLLRLTRLKAILLSVVANKVYR